MSKTKEALTKAQSEIQALTIRQPWAWAIVHAGKDIENRTWDTDFRGEVLIHTSKKLTKKEYEVACEFIELEVDKRIVVPPKAELHCGGVIGIGRLTQVIEPDEECDSPWYVGNYGFVLKDVRPLPFIECRGHLGFWDVPGDILQKIRRSQGG